MRTTLRHKGTQVMPGLKQSPITRALQDPATRPPSEYHTALVFNADLRTRNPFWANLASEITIHQEEITP